MALPVGFEPTTSRLQGEYSTSLSYKERYFGSGANNGDSQVKHH